MEDFRCSFCDRVRTSVPKLICGPRVFSSATSSREPLPSQALQTDVVFAYARLHAAERLVIQSLE